MANSIRIIIADDELLFRKGLARLLGEFEGIQVVGEASNGKELLQQLHSWPQEPPQVLLLDISMPEMDGITATREIRRGQADSATHFPSRTRIIAMTANAMQGDREACLNAGMNDYLSKPIKIEDLKATLERNLDTADAPTLKEITLAASSA